MYFQSQEKNIYVEETGGYDLSFFEEVLNLLILCKYEIIEPCHTLTIDENWIFSKCKTGGYLLIVKQIDKPNLEVKYNLAEIKTLIRKKKIAQASL